MDMRESCEAAEKEHQGVELLFPVQLALHGGLGEVEASAPQRCQRAARFIVVAGLVLQP